MKNFFATIKKIITWLASSVDNHSNGASGRKLTAIVVICLMIHGHRNYVTTENYYNFCVVYIIFVMVLLGMVTIDQLIKFLSSRGSSKEEPKTTTDEPITERK